MLHVELLRRRLGSGRAQADCRLARRGPRKLRGGRAAFRIKRVRSRLRGVEHVGRVRKDDRLDAQFAGHPLDLPHVAGLDPAGDDVRRPARLPRRLGGIIDHAADHVREAGHVRADVAGRVRVDHPLAGGYFSFVARLADDLRDVVADRLREAGGVDGDDVGVVDGEDVRDRLQQVRLPAEDRRALGERTRRGHDRLLVVPRQRAAVIGAAALRAVAVGEAIMDPQGRVHRPDRLAGLGGVDRQRVAFGDFFGRVAKEHGLCFRGWRGGEKRGVRS